jgi:hypothetical protein
MVSGALKTLVEPRFYRIAPRIRLANALALHLPSIYPYLPASTQSEITVRLKRMVSETSDPDLKKAIAAIPLMPAPGREVDR